MLSLRLKFLGVRNLTRSTFELPAACVSHFELGFVLFAIAFEVCGGLFVAIRRSLEVLRYSQVKHFKRLGGSLENRTVKRNSQKFGILLSRIAFFHLTRSLATFLPNSVFWLYPALIFSTWRCLFLASRSKR